MQEKNAPVPNADRRAAMRARLIAAARALFVDKGYAETSTPEIVRAAEVTRGALYHHFADKADLFRAVVEAEAEALVSRIDAEAVDAGAGGMEAGSAAFFRAMAEPGRARLLLIDGPAVLGPDEMSRIDAGGGRASLRAGLDLVVSGVGEAEMQALTEVVSAAFDRAALAIAQGAEPAPFEQAMARLVAGLGER
ncbi:transcriptional regulator, TetR family [Ruegeria pomeroyi DSS-3]|uniref:Transcriptional regulator, TetR family n=2 Tax=Ruegeria pomeroyi TaxID=89184 RepID=Q5LNX3_RUEPO|nr:TetR/AcrR family transcriptional regulator [Ruegeria pomeroyi]AAV96315.1 transcriptional regulator, TetR family [Ruegeria pomeroyi DSS-3]NVK96668.1 helix-turn-helix transcriptional regulator [Ruegeria pomeroyi]NVL03660.1 helix-turn-helix transcriptional regulator [Ruegeria pomeroyi]